MKTRTGLKITLFGMAAALSALLTHGSPPTDDCVAAVGCIATSSGGSAQFDVEAVFDVDTHSSTGSLITFVDSAAGIAVSSSVLTDYADTSPTARNLRFSLNSDFADEARVIVGDNGASTQDTFEIQLLFNGNVVYQEGGSLLASCGGGVTVSQDCQAPPAPPCVVDISVSFQYLDCRLVTEFQKPPQCRPDQPDHCQKHCPAPKNCKKHQKGKNNDDCQKGATQKTYREVCEVKLTYTVRNTGLVPITSLSATDAFGPMDLSSLPLPLAPGSSVSFEVVEEVYGSVPNTVSVTANQNGDTCTASTTILIEKPTQPPAPTNPGTGTPGYWKNHPEAWPVGTITIGGRAYARDEAIAIMKTAVAGDKTFNMFAQLVSAVLNVMIGNDSSCIAESIVAANAWLSANPVGSGVSASSSAWQQGGPLHAKLDAYNNGQLCAPKRD